MPGQNETHVNSFSNLLLINPSFAGLDKNTRFHTGDQFYFISENEAFNNFYVTYDTYSDKLKGGIGFYFQQGLIGELNTSTNELGFTYAGFPVHTKNGNIIFSLNVNALVATKQWYVFMLEEIVNNNQEESNPTVDEFNPYFLLKPRLGILGNMKTFRWGLAAEFPLKKEMNTAVDEEVIKSENLPFGLSLYLSKKIDGNEKGLESKPFNAYPELIVFYNKNFMIGRIRLIKDYIDKSFGLFLQSDITNNIHAVGGTIGLRKKNIRINLTSGVGIPVVSDNIAFTGELSLSLIIPPIHYSEINPWSPQRK
ncbi:MAG: type IX secretion system membrane protein PorP/SprF [Bacteroidota bacterium]